MLTRQPPYRGLPRPSTFGSSASVLYLSRPTLPCLCDPCCARAPAPLAPVRHSGWRWPCSWALLPSCLHGCSLPGAGGGFCSHLQGCRSRGGGGGGEGVTWSIALPPVCSFAKTTALGWGSPVGQGRASLVWGPQACGAWNWGPALRSNPCGNQPSVCWSGLACG